MPQLKIDRKIRDKMFAQLVHFKNNIIGMLQCCSLFCVVLFDLSFLVLVSAESISNFK